MNDIDTSPLVACHSGLFTRQKNCTSIRVLHYPPSDSQRKNKTIASHAAAGSIGCGEHSDYGTITLLFQDDVGGLEVRNRQGEFVPAVPEPGVVLVNMGDLMQRATSDRLLAVVSVHASCALTAASPSGRLSHRSLLAGILHTAGRRLHHRAAGRVVVVRACGLV